MIGRSRFILLAALLALHQSAGAQELLDLNKPITIDVPGMELPFVTSLQTIGGWPLTIRMLANKPLGVATGSAGLFPPAGGNKGWIVWTDPDGCFSLTSYPDGNNPACKPYLPPPGSNLTLQQILDLWHTAPHDETVLEFTLGVASQGSGGSPLWVYGYDVYGGCGNGVICSNSHKIEVGPSGGGYGRSTAVPGLVILSDTGVGREFNTDAVTGIKQTGKARNLAGFVTSVAFTLNDRMPVLPRTSVTAQMFVPYGLFKPILFVDYGNCPHPYTDSNGVLHQNMQPCAVWKWTLDGGPVFAATPTDGFKAFSSKVTTVRVFVVNGPAPEFLADVNGDGVVDSRDAKAAGYTVLSGERVLRFQTFEQEEFPGIPFDMVLGNGDSLDGMSSPPAPAGAGGVVKVPP